MGSRATLVSPRLSQQSWASSLACAGGSSSCSRSSLVKPARQTPMSQTNMSSSRSVSCASLSLRDGASTPWAISSDIVGCRERLHAEPPLQSRGFPEQDRVCPRHLAGREGQRLGEGGTPPAVRVYFCFELISASFCDRTCIVCQNKFDRNYGPT